MEIVLKRATIFIEGRVQGVGFRPAVFRYAKKNNLKGFVCNTAEGVYIEAEGSPSDIEKFIKDIKKSSPRQSIIKKLTIRYRPPLKNETGFVILESRQGKRIQTELSPDIATCKKCLNELFNPEDRRYLFPFINCTDCGPRFTITKKLPYDRKNTTMDKFKMCPECAREYNTPSDRRFHAQPDCCFTCGPEFYLVKGMVLKKGVEAIKEAAALIKNGYIVAVKGTGGYHLMCDAKNKKAIRRLREIKRRGDKPFALMAGDIEAVKKYCYVSKEEKKLLLSWQSPVVLLRKKKNNRIDEEIAPSNRSLGFFLPYTPVHHLLFHFGCPSVIVATSANIAESPIIFRDGTK
ncbi:MAG TPA: Sua5/YciO/YrdC/YwlC family protein, partial [bacterium]|nr:Sua5/YciO/YrdC/YwlC family protein [bacterium]